MTRDLESDPWVFVAFVRSNLSTVSCVPEGLQIGRHSDGAMNEGVHEWACLDEGCAFSEVSFVLGNVNQGNVVARSQNDLFRREGYH